MKEIYLAGGCFWGVQEYFRQITGVTQTRVGYANGETDTPEYKKIAQTNHAETVKVEYDPNVVGLEFLLDMYYKVINPTSVNKQGGDIGTQYRTGIYYNDSTDLAIIEKSIADLQTTLSEKVAVEVEELCGFFDAEDYHQDYLQSNPDGYCHIGKDKFAEAKNVEPKI